MMKIKTLKNKKAQIGATLTWFIVLLIIFFVMILFLTFTIIASRARKIDTEPVAHSSVMQESQRVLISYLNTPTEVDIESEKEVKNMKDLILISLDPYIDSRSGIYFGTWRIGGKTILEKLDGDINKLETLRPSLEEFFIKNPNAKVFDEALLQRSKAILRGLCEDYMLKVPQGVIMPESGEGLSYGDVLLIEAGEKEISETKEDKRDFFIESELESASGQKEKLIKNWGHWLIIKIPYKEQIVEIKYRQLREC